MADTITIQLPNTVPMRAALRALAVDALVHAAPGHKTTGDERREQFMTACGQIENALTVALHFAEASDG